MTFKKFKKDLLEFVRNATVNLGRKTTKTRTEFLKEIESKCTAFETDDGKKVVAKVAKEKEEKSSDSDRLVCMRPKDKKRALDAGKGVVAMTGFESQRADEELGRSPYTKKEKDIIKNANRKE